MVEKPRSRGRRRRTSMVIYWMSISLLFPVYHGVSSFELVAPMSVNENSISKFVAKACKFSVSVVALTEGTECSNYFELGFSREEDRSWARNHGPWCIRGYTYLLEAWSPTNAILVLLDTMWLWVQVHNIPHEYFSKDNGSLFGGKAGWNQESRDGSSSNMNKLAFFVTIVEAWDIKEEVAIYLLRSRWPVTMEFRFHCSGSGYLCHQLIVMCSQVPTPSCAVENTLDLLCMPPTIFLSGRWLKGTGIVGSLDLRQSSMATRRGALTWGRAQQAMWISKLKPEREVPQAAISGIKVDVGVDGMRKVPNTLPGLKSSNLEPIEYRSLENVSNLNKANVEDLNVQLVGRPTT
ncbi:hypothetical protein G4B88_031587 [Cannabis sativa]|uniref:Uncharacterized protein n=1 Tax=Cannabis sativa TaxID=3483 RepID=A0A7J6DLG3_CANSA|nr:hypothetical protein G4B88_031587 [Cannabis sativa]